MPTERRPQPTTGPIGPGTPHARMHAFWDRMEEHEDVIEELTGYNTLRSDYPFEVAVADAFEKLLAHSVPIAEDGELIAVYICDLCGQPLGDKDARCNSGVHQGPDGPNGKRGKAILSTELAARQYHKATGLE